MSALTDFTHDDWRGNSADTTLWPLSETKTGWRSPRYKLARIYRSILAAIVSKLATTLAPLKSDHVYASPLSVAAMIYTTLLWAPMIDFSSVTRLMPEHIAQGLEVAAALWVIAARRTLSRSIAQSVAQRTIVDTGAYRFVRHPIYAGRALLCGAFALSNFNIQNALILLSIYTAQIYQIISEENHLMKDSDYQDYAQKVRYRLIYGVF